MADNYPARVNGRLEEPLSPWLWLVKVFLLIPHFIVLALLGVAAFFLTIVAFFSILFTERYPRSIFDFNVGVMRWAWRVAFYSFSAFGTDRYPPFTLSVDPDYPATLEVDYPEKLSRGLVLVKWWLLAIPHLLVVGVFAGGWGVGFPAMWKLGGGGLISLLAVIAIVIAAFKKQYPQQLFDFIIAMDRWSFRVAVYVALMRDEYPPFRFDLGGTDPGSPPAASGTSTFDPLAA